MHFLFHTYVFDDVMKFKTLIFKYLKKEKQLLKWNTFPTLKKLSLGIFAKKPTPKIFQDSNSDRLLPAAMFCCMTLKTVDYKQGVMQTVFKVVYHFSASKDWHTNLE